MESETGFIKDIVEMIERRHYVKIDFSKFGPNDEKILASLKQRSQMDQYEDDILFDPEHDYGYSYRKPTIMFQEACLLANYKAEYIATFLTHNSYDRLFEELLPIVNENKIKLLPPSVNESELFFEPVDEASIRYTLISNTVFENIIAIRDNEKIEFVNGMMCYTGIKENRQKFVDLDDFVSRIKNAPSYFHPEIIFAELDRLILNGALDCFGHTRKAMFDGWQKFMSGQNSTIVIEHSEEYKKRELGEFELTSLGWAYSSPCFLDDETGEIFHIGSQE